MSCGDGISFIIVQHKWNLPQVDGMEFDQASLAIHG
jgi:hypothetical protein